MMVTSRVLIIPVEVQVRELDAKLLLALEAAKRGYQVYLGSRAYVHFKMARLPRGIYIAKSMRAISERMFRITRQLGHEIVAWEEEALVHPPASTFYSLRLSPKTLSQVSHLFCWGSEHKALMEGYPHLPEKLQLHVTGNPRGDLLRDEYRAHFAQDVAKLKERYGNFVLLNTNYSDVNPFIPAIGLIRNESATKGKIKYGQAGKGMTEEYALGLKKHKQQLFDAFVALTPQLADMFPEVNFVLRPHPSEHHAPYIKAAANRSNIFINTEGNVLPWLLACDQLIHNGCTTAAESLAMGKSPITYMPVESQLYDYDFQGMPNEISRKATTLEQLACALQKPSESCGQTNAEREANELLDTFIEARHDQLATNRILDVLDSISPADTRMSLRFISTVESELKAGLTRLNNHRPGPNRQAYHDHRYPTLTTEDVQQRLDSLHACSSPSTENPIRATAHSEHIFAISATP